MTALAAVFDPAGPAHADAVRRMLSAAAHRGSARSIVWSSGPCTLGSGASITGGGPAPVAFAESADGSALIFDGRLDNASDLCRDLSLTGEITAATVALSACARWAEASAARLLGDFAFVVYDAPRHRVIAARDALGQRPMFYAACRGFVILASESQQILAHPSFDPRPNEGAIAEFLASRPTTVEETVWQGVMRLPPAHALVVDDRGARPLRYWRFDPTRSLDAASEDEYAEQFVALFEQAIACRTRDRSRVGVFLSGGLDSSAIAGCAARSKREYGGAAVSTYSLTFPGSPVDETPFIDAVTRLWNLSSVRLASRVPAREAIEQEIDRYADLPAYPNGAILDPLRRRASADVDVVLTGYGGDDWFTGTPLHTADLIRAGRWLTAARQIRADASLPGRGYTATSLVRAAVAPLLSPRARAILRPLAGLRGSRFEWIPQSFARAVALEDRLRGRATETAGASFAQREIDRVASSLPQVLGDELEDRAAAAAGIEQRHPFNDRRLAEFGFALPEAQRSGAGVTKVVIRRALAPVLPPLVRDRRDKAEFSSTLVETLEGIGGREFFVRLRAAEAGWVNGPAVMDIYDEMLALYRAGHQSYIPLADAAWSVAAVELWLNRWSKEQRA